MKTAIYLEFYLWNENADVRVLQRIEAFAICPQSILQKHDAQFGILRAALKSDLPEVLLLAGKKTDTQVQPLASVRRETATESTFMDALAVNAL